MRDRPVEDLLSSVLSAWHLRAGIDAHPTVCGAWRINTSGTGRSSFHLVGRGECFLHMKGQPPLRLSAGDLVVLPRDDWHVLAPTDGHVDAETHIPESEDGPFTTLLCGHFELDSGLRNPIIEALPTRLVIYAGQAGERLHHLAQLMLIEIEGREPGHRPVLDRLADTLFVMVIRHHVFSSEDKQGLIAALADPRLRQALDAIHQDPGRAWTLEALASEAAMSRSVFAQRFAEVVDATPIEYLTRWRMVLAEQLLHDPRQTVASVMEQVGYQTEAAFRKAYKRVHGRGPGGLRRLVRRLATSGNGADDRA